MTSVPSYSHWTGEQTEAEAGAVTRLWPLGGVPGRGIEPGHFPTAWEKGLYSWGSVLNKTDLTKPQTVFRIVHSANSHWAQALAGAGDVEALPSGIQGIVGRQNMGQEQNPKGHTVRHVRW